MFEKVRSALIFLSLLATLCVPVKAAVEGWKTLQTEHFVFHGDAPEAQFRESARRLEEFRSVLVQVYPKLRFNVPGVSTHVVIFKDAASFRPFRPLRPDGAVDDVVAGFFQAGDDANYVVTAVGGPNGDPSGTLKTDPTGTVFHEYAHFLVHVNFGREDVPPWIDEGLAEYFETFRITAEKTAVLGTRPNGLSIALNPKTIVPPDTMFGTDDAGLREGTRGSRSSFYAQSWALVHYFMHSRPERDRFETLTSLLTDENSAQAAVAKAFGTEPAAFSKALLAYVDQPGLPKTEFPLANKLSASVPASSPASDGEAYARMGDLFLHLDRRDEAATYLRKALAASPDSAAANGSMGAFLIRGGNFVEARKFLERATAVGGTDHFVAFNLAWAVIRGAMNSRHEVEDFPPDVAARLCALLQRSVEAAPDFAESRRLLAFVKLVEHEDLAGAELLAKKAIELEPEDGEHRLLLAQILMRQERVQDARSTAQKLAFLAADARIRVEAAEIVKAADEYYAARNQPPPDKILTVFSQQPPLILKRSAVSDSEIAQFEDDRIVNNLNRILPKPRAGERQAVGYINGVRCRYDGRVEVTATADGQPSVFGARDFSSLRMSVLTDGESTFNIGCGVKFGKQLTVLTYRPPDISKPLERPELVGIAFVPPNFKLKTPEEMAKARLVIVEDDTISTRGRRSQQRQQ